MSIESHNVHMAKQIFGKAMTMEMPKTLIDVCCATPEFAKRCEEETDRLLEPENILQILDIDNEQILLLIARHKGDLHDMGEVLYRYTRGVAENQAFETIKDEMSK